MAGSVSQPASWGAWTSVIPLAQCISTAVALSSSTVLSPGQRWFCWRSCSPISLDVKGFSLEWRLKWSLKQSISFVWRFHLQCVSCCSFVLWIISCHWFAFSAAQPLSPGFHKSGQGLCGTLGLGFLGTRAILGLSKKLWPSTLSSLPPTLVSIFCCWDPACPETVLMR